MLNKLLVGLAALGLVMSSAACNTVRGAGQDVESAADAVDKEI